jgi:hypothetical protein
MTMESREIPCVHTSNGVIMHASVETRINCRFVDRRGNACPCRCQLLVQHGRNKEYSGKMADFSFHSILNILIHAFLMCVVASICNERDM